MEGKDIVGVGFLLFLPGAPLRLFTVRELEGKPEICKERGMLSFPLETVKEDDASPLATIKRLIEEEIGVDPSQVRICGVEEGRFHLIPGRIDITTMYGFGIFDGDPCSGFHPKDSDIVFADWLTLRELARGLNNRVEVAPILEHFVDYHLESFVEMIAKTAT